MERKSFVALVCATLASLASAGNSLAGDDAPVSLHEACNLTDLQGTVRSLGPAAERNALVLVLMSTECPISNSYLPTLNRWFGDWSAPGKNIDLVGFISDETLTRAGAVKHSKEYDIKFPVLFDGSGELAARLKPTHTPEAFVFDAKGDLVYRGRIDDTYAEVGKRRLKPTTNEVYDAVAALADGKTIEPSYQKPIGCLFEQPRAAEEEADVTFNRDIAPIVHANCTSCHRDGKVAPFPLESYADVSKRSEQILAVIKSGLMPPWRPAEEVGHFLGERRLSERQKELFAEWSKAGVPEGEAEDQPAPPVFPSGWQLGTPDLILKVSEKFTIPADGPDIFQNFVLPLNIDTDHYVIAAEFKPGNARVTHHSIFYLDKTGAARRLDEKDPQPGYTTFGGPGFLPTGAVGGWSPGTTPRVLPGEFARYAAAGSDLVLQIHYHPTGKEEVDQSEIGLYFTKTPKNIVANVTVANFGFKLEPGNQNQWVEGDYTLPDDVTLVGVTPHMHLLGREMKVTAKLPEGEKTDLIWIKDWHFYWQDQYYLQSPRRLPKGTTLHVRARYDNSEENPFNPVSPPQVVTFGEETTDEMCFCFFLVATDSPYDLLPVILDNVRHVGKQRVLNGINNFEFLSK